MVGFLKLMTVILFYQSSSCEEQLFSLQYFVFLRFSRQLLCGLHKWNQLSNAGVVGSGSTSTLVVPSSRWTALGDRAFPVAAAQAWNSLPTSVRTPSTYTWSIDPTWSQCCSRRLSRRPVILCYWQLTAYLSYLWNLNNLYSALSTFLW